jgi:hypothetical protein
MRVRTRLLVAGLAFVAAIPVAMFLKFASNTCVATWMKWDVEIAECPDGETHVLASLSANDLRRGTRGWVTLTANASYVVHGALDVRQTRLPQVDATLELVRGSGDKATVTPLEFTGPDDDKGKPTKDKPKNGQGWITLPADLADGDYVLRAKVKTKAGDAIVEAPLALYAPAKIHVVTDRPLYEPGHTVKFRAVVLRARDLVPLEQRPGKWIVRDARGVTVLEEKVDAAEYGIVEGELPLDKSSPVGTWHVRYESGGAVDDVGIEVKPFELPRFTVSVEPSKPFYGAKDEPRVNVKVATAAGVPIVTELDVEWFVNSQSGWPAPPEWTAALPKKAKTDKSGRSELTVPRVPADLQGKVSIACRVSARDDTGDQEVGQGTVLLSEDAIDVSLVTELGTFAEPGLVEGINNRAYMRATTAAGMPLVGATLTVSRTWDKSDKGVVVTTDEDGVAAMQIDPGPAVNIVIPPMPVRLPPPPPLVERTMLDDTLGDGDVPLGVIAAMDRMNGAVGACARFAEDGADAQLALRVEGSGRIARASASGPLANCIGDQLTSKALPPGPPRILNVGYSFAPRLASLGADVQGMGELPNVVQSDLDVALMDARDCLGPLTVDAMLPRVFSWEVHRGTFTGSWGRDPNEIDQPLNAQKAACVEARLSRVLRTRDALSRAERFQREQQGLSDDDDDGSGSGDGGTSFGVVRFNVSPVYIDGAPAGPQATTMLGYELLVNAKSGDEAVGKTKVRIRPGQIPSIRLRASDVITEPGAEVTIDILRGPTFEGELPKKLALTHPDLSLPLESDVDEKSRSAKFKLPADKDGWYEARFGEGLARIFVPKRTTLSVKVEPDKQSYKPGETAKLSVTTRGAEKGMSAAVGLFGVDDTLGQIASLPGPGDMDRLTTTVSMHAPAFNVLDATALSLGRVRGKNAAAATVLLVSSVPTPVEIDVAANAFAQTPFDPAAPLADRFYTVLEDLYVVVRGFEAKAPKDEKLTPQKMLALWDDALAAAKKRGKETTDVFGRPMKLALLPDALIELTDPRLVVADGTRLPEDIEAWTRFVKTNGGKS